MRGCRMGEWYLTAMRLDQVPGSHKPGKEKTDQTHSNRDMHVELSFGGVLRGSQLGQNNQGKAKP